MLVAVANCAIVFEASIPHRRPSSNNAAPICGEWIYGSDGISSVPPGSYFTARLTVVGHVPRPVTAVYGCGTDFHSGAELTADSSRLACDGVRIDYMQNGTVNSTTPVARSDLDGTWPFDWDWTYTLDVGGTRATIAFECQVPYETGQECVLAIFEVDRRWGRCLDVIPTINPPPSPLPPPPSSPPSPPSSPPALPWWDNLLTVAVVVVVGLLAGVFATASITLLSRTPDERVDTDEDVEEDIEEDSRIDRDGKGDNTDREVQQKEMFLQTPPLTGLKW